ncbi:MAG: hypothetical protein JNK02_14215 [Planctomycetes bacterium]|nr:hypothetical protein [Planctomycetota bacterium]
MHVNYVLTASALALFATPGFTGRLIALDASRAIYELDRATGAKVQIGTAAANAGTPGGLARDPATGSVFLTSSTTDSLYRLDLATGAASLVGFHGSTSFVMTGLEWDSAQQTLWGASNGNLYRVNPASGATQQIGVTGLTSFTNLAYVPATDTLYLTNVATDALYTIDRSVGQLTVVGPLGSTAANASGLAYDTDAGLLYLVDSVSDVLYTVSLATGAATPVGSTGPGNLQALVFLPDEASFVPFCFGDGGGTACPCGNAGAPGQGCANSIDPGGARLVATGSPSIAADSLRLSASGMPNSSALYFQGTSLQAGGVGSTFGDGLRCAGGTLIRLGTLANTGGASAYPGPGDVRISVRGQCTAGDSRTYQVWYRNAATYCTPSTFNLSNGLGATWSP